jgi:protein-tyrosine phosphatase
MALKFALLPLAVAFGLQGAAHAAVTAEKVERIAPDRIAVTWTDARPVDVFVAESADLGMTKARLAAGRSTAGRVEIATAATSRPYVLLHEAGGKVVVRVAERALPLEQGSNFRDIGGYPAAGGKHVRWGRIFRSGGTPMLSEADQARIGALGLRDLVDLRSDEERSLAPTRIDGVRYTAIGYPMTRISGSGPNGFGDIRAAYRRFPTMLAPQLRVLFQTLLAQQGPMAYNCSAGQDRTGFATAMVLSALGVPREVILADYHLSTVYRRPDYEMPRIDPSRKDENAATALFVQVQTDTRMRTPQPLFDAEHKALLSAAFDEVEQHWGSVDAYLQKELGVGPAERARLRAAYLE